MSVKMWQGRFSKPLDKMADEFNSSIKIDSQMYEFDILGSIAHATMLGATNIISADESEQIINGLNDILNDIKLGTLKIDMSAEDIHMFIEATLTERIGEVGKKLHTARSRNDQVALDTRLVLSSQVAEIKKLLIDFLQVIYDKACLHTATVMAGYTHLQQAQPITYAHYLMAYASMFMRDIDRLDDCDRRIKVSPLGCCALAGTTMPIDRAMTAKLLGFKEICLNSIDGVSDRDFVIELANCIAIIMLHLSRFSEEIILFCSHEFKYIELDDAFSTGSSIMPQKKNPDIAELVRGKTGRVYGNLINLLTTMKALPLAYNKDMQEDKEAIFDSVETAKLCIANFSAMLATLTINKDNMLKNAAKGFINATDVADYLVKKGMAFRTAYKLTGELVAKCIENNTTLEKLTIAEFKAKSELFDTDIYQSIDLLSCVEKRTSTGAPSVRAVNESLNILKNFIDKSC
ncbi:MAG: argininosuccinate lyase [Clostridia bacterium]